MDAKLHKAVSELDEYIDLCRKRIDGVLTRLNWTENVTLRDTGAKVLEREDSEDEADPPLPKSFGCENSVVIGVDQLKAIINAKTATIAKKFSDIQLNYTREQKREIYDYVIYNTKKLSEPEMKVTISNNHQPTTNMTIAEIVAKAKANAKIQRRKYSTSKPTHIEEVREMLNLQMQALNQLYKPKPEQPYTNISLKPHLDMRSPFKAPSSADSYCRSKSYERRSVFRRPSLDMVSRVRPPSSERASRIKSRDGGSPFRRLSLDMINAFRAPSCESTSSGERCQGDYPSENSYRQRSQRRSREYLACGSPRVDRISRSRSMAIESTESGRGSLRGQEQSIHLRRTSSDRVDMSHGMSDRMGQTNDEPAARGTPLRIRVNQSTERSPMGSFCKHRMQQMSDRGSHSNDEPNNMINPFKAKADNSSARATQSQDRRSQCCEKSSKTNVYRSTHTIFRSDDMRMQNRDKRSRSKSLQLKPERGGHRTDERRGRYNQAKNSCRRYSQSGGQGQSWERRRSPASPCTGGMHRESGGKGLSNAGQDRRSLKQRRDGRHQSEENSTEKEKMRNRGRSKSQSRDKKTRRDKRSHDKVERQQQKYRSRRDKHRSHEHDKRYPSSCSSEIRSQSSSTNSSSSSRCKCKAKRRRTRESRRGSKKSAKRSSHATVGDMQQTQDNIKCSRRSSSARKLLKPPQHQASPKKSKRRSKSRAQDERLQPNLSSTIEVRKRSRWDSMSASDTRLAPAQVKKQTQTVQMIVSPQDQPPKILTKCSSVCRTFPRKSHQRQCWSRQSLAESDYPIPHVVVKNAAKQRI